MTTWHISVVGGRITTNASKTERVLKLPEPVRIGDYGASKAYMHKTAHKCVCCTEKSDSGYCMLYACNNALGRDRRQCPETHCTA